MGERAEATSIGSLWSDSVTAAVASAATYAERHQVGWVAKAWLVAPRGALGQVEWVGMVLVVVVVVDEVVVLVVVSALMTPAR